nr:lactate racemase domain-containing protein [Campylobacter rectus]
MQIPIAYGKEDVLHLRIDERNLLGVFNPNPVAKFDETALIAKALANPINQKSFDEFIAGDEKIVVIVNDGTRPTPTAKILKQIYPKIREKNKNFHHRHGLP